jgi:Flp pilus assembly protein TadD
MGRSRRRQRQEQDQHPVGAQAPILTPTYVPVRSEPESGPPVIEAPVLPIEGLEPWAEIRGPALAIEEPTADDDILGLTFNHPDQLELERRTPGEESGAPEDAHAETAEAHAAPGGTDAEAAGEPAVASTTLKATDEPPAADAALAVPAPRVDAAESLYARARREEDEGHTDAAKRTYREILAEFPQHLRARNNLALLLDAGGDHQGALAELDRALDMDPDETTLLTNRGAMLGAMGRYAAAERDLRRVLRVEPGNAEALFNLGVVLTKKGLWGEAVPVLRHATELAPHRGAAFYYLGESLNHVDELLGSLAAYLRAAELQPANARALYGLGIIYDRLARPDDAAVMYRKARAVGRR